MKTIVLTSGGSARVESAESTTIDPAMKTPYRLWILEDDPEDQLAYVQRRMQSSGGRVSPVYHVSDREGTRVLTPEEWRTEKESATQTDALAEAGPRGVQLIRLALQGKITYSEAVRRIDERDPSPTPA